MGQEEDALEKRRKRLLYQSRHRGTKESDLFLGAFADHYLQNFTAEQLTEYDAILAETDDVLFNWIYGRAKPPPARNGRVMRLLLTFRYRL